MYEGMSPPALWGRGDCGTQTTCLVSKALTYSLQAAEQVDKGMMGIRMSEGWHSSHLIGCGEYELIALKGLIIHFKLISSKFVFLWGDVSSYWTLTWHHRWKAMLHSTTLCTCNSLKMMHNFHEAFILYKVSIHTYLWPWTTKPVSSRIARVYL